MARNCRFNKFFRDVNADWELLEVNRRMSKKIGSNVLKSKISFEKQLDEKPERPEEEQEQIQEMKSVKAEDATKLSKTKMPDEKPKEAHDAMDFLADPFERSEVSENQEEEKPVSVKGHRRGLPKKDSEDAMKFLKNYDE